MTTPKKSNVEALRLEFEYQCRIRHAHEVLWREQWDAILSPFEAVAFYCSNQQRAKRDKVLKPWRDAKDAMNLAKYGTTDHD